MGTTHVAESVGVEPDRPVPAVPPPLAIGAVAAGLRLPRLGALVHGDQHVGAAQRHVAYGEMRSRLEAGLTHQNR